MRRTGGRASAVAMFAVLLLGTSGLAYGVNRASAGWERPGATKPVAPVSTDAPSATPTPTPDPTPTATPPHVTPVTTPVPRPTPKLLPGKRVLGPGDRGPEVRRLQARLRQIAWYAGNVDDSYGPATTAAVRGFQAKRKIPATGEVDKRTLQRLRAMTREPTADELANKLPGGTSTSARLDPRCTTGRAVCIDKSSRTVRWVVDGKVLRTMAVRFGSSYSPTREGLFRIGWKSRNHHSKLYDSAMPFALFFSGGQAVHYSSDFAARGYSGASHGCVNVRDYAGVKWLFDQVVVGDKVVVYWS